MPKTLQEWLDTAARQPTPLERMRAWLAANEHAGDGTVYAMTKAQVEALIEDVDSASRARRLEREAQVVCDRDEVADLFEAFLGVAKQVREYREQVVLWLVDNYPEGR